MASSQSTGGIGFFGLLTIVLIVLKLTKTLSWSWWWVLAPIWLPTILAFGIAGVFIALSYLVSTRSRRNG